MNKFLRVVVFLAGTAAGPGILMLVLGFMNNYFGLDVRNSVESWMYVAMIAGSVVLFGVIFFFLSKPIAYGIAKLPEKAEKQVSRQPFKKTIGAIAGVIVGLLAAYLLKGIFSSIKETWLLVPISVVLYLVCAFLFGRIVGEIRLWCGAVEVGAVGE